MKPVSRLTTLPGGLRIATCEMPHTQTAAMGIWASVGGRHEPAALNGISHFIEHMLFKGTRRRSARRIMEDVEGVGGDINAFTSEERTCYYAASAAEHFPRVCDVLCDIYMEPRFSPRDIDRERGVIAEEIQMYCDEPSSHVQELLQQTYWQGHPLGRPLTGTHSTIATMDAAAFRSYRAAHYTAPATVVTAAGNIRHAEVVDRVSGLLSGLPQKTPAPAAAYPRIPAKPRIAAEARDIQQTQLSLALPAPGINAPLRHAFLVLNTILGANASSRLFQELREKRGLCYSVSSNILSLRDGGLLEISAGLDRRNLEKSLRIVLAAIESLRKKPVAPRELRRAVEFLIGSGRMALERTSTQSSRLGNSILAKGKIVDPETITARIRATTPDDILAAARAFLDPSRITLAVVGPNPDTPMLRKLLAAE
ncbi:MAG: insulinase family protein [Verrucomicrobia bacterium]|nr:insulinase family protein [Verrucomicrobiota bacterium]